MKLKSVYMNLHGECVLIFLFFFKLNWRMFEICNYHCARVWGPTFHLQSGRNVSALSAAKKRQIKFSTPICGYSGNFHQATIKTGTVVIQKT